MRRWITGFEESHGRSTFTVTDGALDLLGMDGSTARCASLVPFSGSADALPDDFLAHIEQDHTVVLLLLRRGGYGVGVLQGGALAASKVGTRYVQSRTAAGGWSQHRFARRRDNQAAGLVDTAAATAVRVVLGEDGREPPSGAVVVTGGDRTMVDRLLEDRRLAKLAALPRLRHLDVPDPRDDVLRQSAQRAVAVQIQVHNA
ncbi:acVLRF1 family peptidyl-tRNA hydrolase [Angustibacter luteus]